MKLWETSHPYYCSQATYDEDRHFEHASTEDFLKAFGTSDSDLNYVIRWDWQRNTNEKGEPISIDGTFYVFHVAQRKGFLQSAEFSVFEKDEPILREWLANRWEKVRENWNPINTRKEQQESQPNE